MKKLSDYDLDVLKELANISLGNSSKALSKILGRFINVKITNIDFLDKKKLLVHLGGDQNVVTICLGIGKEIKGMAVNILSVENSIMFINELNRMLHIKKEIIDDYGIDTLKEFSTIVTNSYLTNLSKMVDISFILSSPKFFYGNATNIVEEINPNSDIIFHIHNELYCEDFAYPIYSDLIIIFYDDSMSRVISAAKAKIKQ